MNGKKRNLLSVEPRTISRTSQPQNGRSHLMPLNNNSMTIEGEMNYSSNLNVVGPPGAPKYESPKHLVGMNAKIRENKFNKLSKIKNTNIVMGSEDRLW